MMMKRLLFVDDEETIRFLAAEFLRDEGFDVVEAESGDDAMRCLHQPGKFDVLVSDVQMPGSRDGVDLVACARAILPNIAVVVVSGYAASLSERLETLRQPYEFLPKPFHLTELADSIEQAASQ